MTNYNELRDGQEFYANGYKEGYKQAILDGKTNFSRPQGEWEFAYEYDGEYYFACTNCNTEDRVPTDRGKPLYYYCPNCGADMRGKNNGN